MERTITIRPFLNTNETSDLYITLTKHFGKQITTTQDRENNQTILTLK